MLHNRIHKVGTLTLGIMLVVTGIAFLMHLFFPALTYYNILKAWPVVFIFLGIEILLAVFRTKDDTLPMVYDKAAIFLTAMLILFAMFTGAVSMVMEKAVNISI